MEEAHWRKHLADWRSRQSDQQAEHSSLLVNKARAAFGAASGRRGERTVARPVLDPSQARVTFSSLLLNLKPLGPCATLK